MLSGTLDFGVSLASLALLQTVVIGLSITVEMPYDTLGRRSVIRITDVTILPPRRNEENEWFLKKLPERELLHARKRDVAEYWLLQAAWHRAYAAQATQRKPSCSARPSSPL
jgi:hypothetical protein